MSIKTTWGAKVSSYLEELSKKHPARWEKVSPKCDPYGDVAYGLALSNRNSDWFSYSAKETPCPYLTEFADELSDKFGLIIHDQKTGELRRQASAFQIRTKKIVYKA